LASDVEVSFSLVFTLGTSGRYSIRATGSALASRTAAAFYGLPYTSDTLFVVSQ
jgi:hypothetical protein